jgi:hypothetical protein
MQRARIICAIEVDLAESLPPYSTLKRAFGSNVSLAFRGRSIASCIDTANQDFSNLKRRFWITCNHLRRLSIQSVAEFFQRLEIARSNQIKQLACQLIKRSNPVARAALIERTQDCRMPHLRFRSVLVAYRCASH